MSKVSLVRMFGISLPDPWEKGTEEQQKGAYRFMQSCGWEIRKSMLLGPERVSLGIVVEEMEALLATSPYKNAPVQVAYTGDIEEGVTWTHLIAKDSETVVLNLEDPGTSRDLDRHSISSQDEDAEEALEELGKLLGLGDPEPKTIFALRKGNA